MDVRPRDASGRVLEGEGAHEMRAFWHRLEIKSKEVKIGMLHCHDEVLRQLNYQEVRSHFFAVAGSFFPRTEHC